LLCSFNWLDIIFYLNPLSWLDWLARLDMLTWLDILDRLDWLDILNWLVDWLEYLDNFYALLNRLHSVGSLNSLRCFSWLCSVDVLCRWDV